MTVFGISLSLLVSGCSSNPPNPPAKEAEQSAPATPAPASVYENKLVRRPGTSIEDSKVYVVQNGKKRWVVNASWFAAHGYKFPDQVQQVPAADLDAIPTGDPIQ
jgi:hypothetical protein